MIYVIRFISYTVWGVVYPFLAVWLIGLRVFDDGAVGLVVGVAVITNRVGSLAFVHVVERYDKRLAIIASQVMAVVASVALHLLSVGPTGSVLAWAFVGGLFGLANSLATLAQVTFIAQQFPHEERKRAFAYENISLNIAGGVAPLLSSFVIVSLTGSYALVPIAFAVTTTVLAVRLPRDAPVEAPVAEPSGVDGFRGGDRLAVLGFIFLTMVAYGQFYGVFPVYAVADLGEGTVGLLFAASSVMIVVLQAVVLRLSTRFDDVRLIVVANVFMAAGSLLLIFTSGGVRVVLVAVLCVALAEMVSGPLYQTLAVQAFHGRATRAMGAVTFVWGVGEAGTIVVGLALVDAGLGAVSFLVGAAAALAVAVLATALRRRLLRLGRVAVPSAG
ncbi:MFS transporter [Actinophytocola oryzae]|uniref:Nitrate/nitrite transporter NarK n=1 Tax=Actinophytocola oryzae TaxID=502181 RepID=A0A4R7UW13_9PSEU|nr:MFS transporter [Actinophytocola oryzae]TDV40958.1 nitrate/nitrite transporter NarK [Actinophytocola oryzae]